MKQCIICNKLPEPYKCAAWDPKQTSENFKLDIADGRPTYFVGHPKIKNDSDIYFCGIGCSVEWYKTHRVNWVKNNYAIINISLLSK